MGKAMKITFDDKMMVAAHRGDCYNYYENTMEAFEAAIDSGVEMIETDVHLTKDNVLVLIHDHTVDRTTDGKGLVSDYTYEELLKLNAGRSEDPQKIPTFEEMLKLLAEKNILLNLEIKEYYTEGNEERCDYCIDECVKLIEKYNYAEKMVFNSFDAHVLEYVDEKYNGKYLLHGFYPYYIMKNVKRNPDEYLYCACIFEDGKKEHYEYLQSKGIEPWIGASVTQEGHLKECFEMGAKLITTNFPENCIQKLEKVGAR